MWCLRARSDSYGGFGYNGHSLLTSFSYGFRLFTNGFRVSVWVAPWTWHPQCCNHETLHIEFGHKQQSCKQRDLYDFNFFPVEMLGVCMSFLMSLSGYCSLMMHLGPFSHWQCPKARRIF